VDFWFFSFSFDFGAAAKAPDPLTLQQFYQLCEKSGPPDTSPSSVATGNLTVQLKISLEDGSFSMPPEDTVAGQKPDDSGAGVKWFVKGGSFQFRVSSVFAVTEAYVETEDSAKRTADGKTILLGKQDVSLMQEVLPVPAQSKLSSMPMQLSADFNNGNGIDSKLSAGIQSVDDEGEVVTGFKPSFVIKAMPLTLWADPNNPPNRLSQDKGTVDLPMAVVFKAPDPILAKAKVPAFNAVDMAKACAGKLYGSLQKIVRSILTKVSGANTVPQLPAVTQQDLLPEAEDASEATLTEKWATMQKTWENSSKINISLANELTQLCMSVLGWDKPSPDVEAKAKAANIEPWKVPVAFPTRLVDGTGREDQGIEDGLSSFYLDLPRITVATVH
jgi:hypothetical protein